MSNKVISPLLQINALDGIFWRKMKVYDSYKKVYYTVVNKKRYLTKTHKCNYILAFDTETYKGNVKLIARYGLKGKNRYIYEPSFDECLDFLFYYAYKPFGYRFFYNIDFDISAILKLWNNIEQINYLRKGIEIEYKDYKLFWIKGKFFKLTKNKRSVCFTDLFSFFKIGLEKASKTYLKDLEKDKIDGNLLNTSLSYWSNNLERIINYCVLDCKITYNLAWLLVKSILKAKISLPKYLVSAGSLAKQDFRTNCQMSNLYNVPKEIVQIAYNCYFGGKFEIQTRGYFEKLFLYDINSQYPSIIRNMYDINYGIWKKIDYLPKKQCFGYFKVDLSIPENLDISTIPFRIKNSVILTCCGNVKNRWFTWYDLDLMRNYITKIHKAYLFKPTKTEKEVHKSKLGYVIPFRKRIDYHYEMKQKYKGNNKLMYNIHKITMNALYGSFIERHTNEQKDGTKKYSVGVLFNPIFASQITAFGRWSVIKDIPKSKWKFISGIHTDSLLSEIPLNDYITLNNNIGNWNLEIKGKGLIINTGIYQINDLVKVRGIPLKYIRNWFDFAKKHKFESEFEFKILRMRKISETIVRDKNLDKLNIMIKELKTVKVNSDSKRHWISKFRDFNDLTTRKIRSKLWFANMNGLETEINFKNLGQNPLLPRILK